MPCRVTQMDRLLSHDPDFREKTRVIETPSCVLTCPSLPVPSIQRSVTNGGLSPGVPVAVVTSRRSATPTA